MSYTVIWSDIASPQLAMIWLQSTDRNAITRAQDRIDKSLGQDPRHSSTEIANNLFTFNARPLQVLFEINEDDRIVRVEAVRLLP